ncbi:MAG: ceramidase domain-containing protein [Hyphomicrobiaceae bacterium]|nr:ceramidase domain-containing protein [Hyphomicrobiaceae bacterium]
MSWTAQVFNYCERGFNASFWAEPFNAASNSAFLLASLAAAAALRRRPEGSRAERIWLWSLVALVAVIGVGSFLFHTFATRWALLADVIPITIFMVVYLAFALRHFLGLGWLPILLILPAFVATGSIAGELTCPKGRLVSAVEAAREPCFNGSLGYLPALIALSVIGALASRRQAHGRLLLVAAGIFTASVALRTLDRDICASTRFFGELRGTHALWHMLNGATLYVLLRAAIERTGRSMNGKPSATPAGMP